MPMARRCRPHNARIASMPSAGTSNHSGADVCRALAAAAGSRTSVAGQEDKASPAFTTARFVARGSNRSVPLEAMPSMMGPMNVCLRVLIQACFTISLTLDEQ